MRKEYSLNCFSPDVGGGLKLKNVTRGDPNFFYLANVLIKKQKELLRYVVYYMIA